MHMKGTVILGKTTLTAAIIFKTSNADSDDYSTDRSKVITVQAACVRRKIEQQKQQQQQQQQQQVVVVIHVS